MTEYILLSVLQVLIKNLDKTTNILAISTNILGKRQFSSVVSSNNHYPEMLDNNLKKRSLVMKDYLFNIKSELDKI